MLKELVAFLLFFPWANQVSSYTLNTLLVTLSTALEPFTETDGKPVFSTPNDNLIVLINIKAESLTVGRAGLGAKISPGQIVEKAPDQQMFAPFSLSPPSPSLLLLLLLLLLLFLRPKYWFTTLE